MKNLIRIIIVFCAVGTGFGTCKADDVFTYYKQAVAPSAIENEIGAITLDDDLYRNTDNSFANLRIFDENNDPVPYLIRTQKVNKKVLSRYPVPLTTLAFEELPDNRINIVLENKNRKSVPSELIIQTPNKNFEKRVSLYGSNDKEKWELIAEDQLIFDYSKFIDLRNTRISFKEAPFRYFKISINNASEALKSPFSQIFTKYSKEQIQETYEEYIQYEGALRIDKVSFLGKKEQVVYGKERLLKYPLKITKTSLIQDDKISEIYLSSDRHPLKKLVLDVKSNNFKRKVIVEAVDDLNENSNWSRISSAEIFDMTAGQFHKKKFEIDLPRVCRYLQYRLKIINQDNMPIDVASARGEGPIHEILFFHKGQKELRVSYGGEGFELPRYDVSSVLSETPPISGSRWDLSEQKYNEKAARNNKPFLSYKTILAAVLILMVGVLVYLLAFSVKKVEEQTED